MNIYSRTQTTDGGENNGCMPMMNVNYQGGVTLDAQKLLKIISIEKI